MRTEAQRLKANLATKRWREKYPDRHRQKCRAWYAQNRNAQVEKFKARDAAARREIIGVYGGVCVCCGERRLHFLALDHIFDDGADYRRAGKKSGTTLYMQLKREGYPKYLQVLCHNCNVSKGLYGYCPHGNCWRSMNLFA